MGLTPLAMSTTSLRPTSPRVAATTSGGRPKTNGSGRISTPVLLKNTRIRGLTSLGNLANSRVLVVKSGDKGERFTPSVDLVMDRTLGEDGSLALSHRVDDEASTVLLDKPSFHRAVNNEQELGRARMCVGRVHSTRPVCITLERVPRRRMRSQDLRHLTDSHGHAICKKRGEVGDIGDGEGSACIGRGTNSGSIIEQPLIQAQESAG